MSLRLAVRASPFASDYLPWHFLIFLQGKAGLTTRCQWADWVLEVPQRVLYPPQCLSFTFISEQWSDNLQKSYLVSYTLASSCPCGSGVKLKPFCHPDSHNFLWWHFKLHYRLCFCPAVGSSKAQFLFYFCLRSMQGWSAAVRSAAWQPHQQHHASGHCSRVTTPESRSSQEPLQHKNRQT